MLSKIAFVVPLIEVENVNVEDANVFAIVVIDEA
jgi:hypothetical protein